MNKKLTNQSKLLDKLNTKLKECDYYEAHQLYKIIYFRYINSSKFEEALLFILEGALNLLSNNQITSGYDLSMLALEGIKKNPSNLTKLARIFQNLPKDSLERTQYHCTCFDIFNTLNLFLANLHSEFAKVLWLEKNYSQARYHFIRSSDGESCATMLIEYSTSCGYPSEIDLFIAQAVFQYLCLKNQLTAQITFNFYVKFHPVIHKENPPFSLPLLNFLCFLLISIQSNAKISVFQILCDKYEPSLKRDPSFFEYLNKIGQIFFGMNSKNNQSLNMFDNIFQSLVSNFQNSMHQNENISYPTSSHNNSNLIKHSLKEDDVD